MKLLLKKPTLKFAKPVKPVGHRIERPDYFGSSNPEIVFVVDPLVGKDGQDEAPVATRPLTPKQMEFLTKYCSAHKIPIGRSAIIASMPPVTKDVWDSQKKLSDRVKLAHEAFTKTLKAAKPKVIVAMGKCAASQVLNRAAKITQLRGTPQANDEYGALLFATLGAAHVIRVPDTERTFNADMATLKKIIDAGYTLEYQDEIKQDYHWCTDLSDFLARADKGELWLSVDTEYTGGEYYEPSSRLLTVQLSDAAGSAYCVPIDYNHIDHKSSPNMLLRKRMQGQLKRLLEHPNVKVFGQNFKGDVLWFRHKLGIEIKNFEDDTILLQHGVDENMLEKSLTKLSGSTCRKWRVTRTTSTAILSIKPRPAWIWCRPTKCCCMPV